MKEKTHRLPQSSPIYTIYVPLNKKKFCTVVFFMLFSPIKWVNSRETNMSNEKKIPNLIFFLLFCCYGISNSIFYNFFNFIHIIIGGIVCVCLCDVWGPSPQKNKKQKKTCLSLPNFTFIILFKPESPRVKLSNPFTEYNLLKNSSEIFLKKKCGWFI